MTEDVSLALAGIPLSLREELLNTFNAVISNHRESRWEAAELNAGKLCEVVYTIIRGRADGTYPATSSKPRDMVRSCRELEQIPSTSLERALRIQIPRVIMGIYEMRNNRNVGHVGGDVDPSYMDSEFATAASRWMVADLVRAYHGVTTEEATQIVKALTQREIPLIWESNGTKRVLSPSIQTAEKVMILLYATPGPVHEDVLRKWVEYKNVTRFRKEILGPLHKVKKIEYDSTEKMIYLLPPGSYYVEKAHLNGSS